MSYSTPIEETMYILVTENGPIDDRVFDTYEDAIKGKNELISKGLILENVTVSTTKVRKHLLTE